MFVHRTGWAYWIVRIPRLDGILGAGLGAEVIGIVILGGVDMVEGTAVG